jgi:hypothetical protein
MEHIPAKAQLADKKLHHFLAGLLGADHQQGRRREERWRKYFRQNSIQFPKGVLSVVAPDAVLAR